jgi:hypothetical protein
MSQPPLPTALVGCPKPKEPFPARENGLVGRTPKPIATTAGDGIPLRLIAVTS